MVGTVRVMEQGTKVVTENVNAMTLIATVTVIMAVTVIATVTVETVIATATVTVTVIMIVIVTVTVTVIVIVTARMAESASEIVITIGRAVTSATLDHYPAYVPPWTLHFLAGVGMVVVGGVAVAVVVTVAMITAIQLVV